MSTIFWIWISFILGGMPFSYWIGKFFIRQDIRDYGDANPGAANAWKAGGWKIGFLALVLDYSKGLMAVGLAHFLFGLSGWGLVFTSLASILGHAYSPFLGFKGGKALATTFGVWTGLTLGEGPLILGSFFALFLFVQRNHGWAVLLGMLGFLAHLFFRGPDLNLIAVWGGNFLVLTWKYRNEIRMGWQSKDIFKMLKKQSWMTF